MTALLARWVRAIRPQTRAVVAAQSRCSERWLFSPITWGVVLMLGAAMRFRQYLAAQSFWYDEAFLILVIRDRSYAELLGGQRFKLVIPTGFLWLTRAMEQLVGGSELSLRLPAFAAGLAALGVMLPLSRGVVGPRHALWAFAWCALSRHAVQHGCDVRPYTFDLLFTTLILLSTAAILIGTRCVWAAAGLGVLAVTGPWLSFPSPFLLAGSSAALAVHLSRNSSRRGWTLWAAFNALVALSGLAVWWFSSRHMYYAGMAEHWGHLGWGGFPDWGDSCSWPGWLLTRPGEMGDYGTRSLGLVLTLLAAIGTAGLTRRSLPLAVLLTGPFLVALAAALMGKYPMAHRTTFFLLPCLWLLGALGIKAITEWAARYWRPAVLLGTLLIGAEFGCAIWRTAVPDSRADYRAAFQYIQTHRQDGDVIWPRMYVVYETYHGIDMPVLIDIDGSRAERVLAHKRLWAVIGSDQDAIRRRLTAVREPALTHRVSGLDVLLFDQRERTNSLPDDIDGAILTPGSISTHEAW